MSRHDSAPTVGYFLANRVYKFVMIVMLIPFLLLIGFGLWALRVQAVVDHDCSSYYRLDIKPFGSYWVHTEIGSTEPGCPQPWQVYE